MNVDFFERVSQVGQEATKAKAKSDLSPLRKSLVEALDMVVMEGIHFRNKEASSPLK